MFVNTYFYFLSNKFATLLGKIYLTDSLPSYQGQVQHKLKHHISIVTQVFMFVNTYFYFLLNKFATLLGGIYLIDSLMSYQGQNNSV